jgi:hypothetical protein
MTLSLAYNTTDGPVLADEAGYLIDGKSWGPVDTTDPIGKGELDSGRLILADEDAAAGSDNAEAKAAVERLAERRERVAAAKAQSKAELAEQVPDEVLATLPVGSDGQPAKSDLVDAVVATDQDDTASPKPRRGARQQ